jgi:transcriptional regulator with XRE-family HTH domain
LTEIDTDKLKFGAAMPCGVGAVKLLGRPIDREVFRRNLDRLMTMTGMRNATLAREMELSREVVGLWRRGEVLPNLTHFRQLLFIFDCDVNAFTGHHPSKQVLTLKQWAMREEISLARARALFDKGFLSGAWTTGEQVFVPPTLRVPDNSKQLVMKAKRQPVWGAAVVTRLRLSPLNRREIAEELGVSTGAVDKWCNGTGYPSEDRLAKIAEVLGVSLDELTTMPRFSEAHRVDDTFAAAE